MKRYLHYEGKGEQRIVLTAKDNCLYNGLKLEENINKLKYLLLVGVLFYLVIYLCNYNMVCAIKFSLIE